MRDDSEASNDAGDKKDHTADSGTPPSVKAALADALGPPAGWPAPLACGVEMVLAAGLPMAIVWGEDRQLVYNEAATALIDGGTYAVHLGLSLAAAQSPLARAMEPLVERAMATLAPVSATAVASVPDVDGYRNQTVTLSVSCIGGDSARGALVIFQAEDAPVQGDAPSFDHLRELADGLPLIIAYVDHTRRYRFRNDGHRQWIKLPDSEVIDHDMADVLGGEGFAALEPHLNAVLAGEARRFAIPMVHRSGERRHVEVDYVPHRSDGGAVAGFFVVARDVTEARAQEDELRRSRERLRLIFDSAIDYAIIVLDGDGRVTSWNSGAERLLGYEEEEVLGQDGSIFFTPEDRKRGLPQRERARSRQNGHASNERWHVRKDGSRFWGSGAIVPLVSGEEGGYLKILRDRTAERAAQENTALARHQAEVLAAEQAALLSQLAEGVIVTDPAGRITFINRSAAELHGVAHLDVPPEEYADKFQLYTVEGRPYPPEELPLARAVRRRENVVEERWRIRRPDGTEVLAIGSAKPVLAPDGQVIGNVLTMRDDTERAEAEQALREVSVRKDLALSAGRMGVWEWNPRERVMFWDDAQFALFGVDKETPASLELFRACTVDTDFDAILAQASKRAADGEPFEIDFRIRRADSGELRWIGARAISVCGEAGRQERMIGVNFDLTERRNAEDRRTLLINELNHRVKNTLATVQSIAAQTFRASRVGRELRDLFEARLVALSNAHNVLTRESWEGAPLSDVVAQTLHPFRDVNGGDSLSISGPALRTTPKAALALAMALHELATNAVRYGALSIEGGRVEIAWRLRGGTFVMEWRERNGPPVQPPAHRGFGTRLVGSSLAGELNGVVDLRFDADGLTCRIEAPEETVSRGMPSRTD